jgi:hypothetical protein
LSSPTGNGVTFTAGLTAGTLGLFVNATLNGVTKMSSAVVITITATPPPTLSSVAVLPASDIVAAGGTTSPFTATPTCSAACPVGTTYFWTITNGAMGTLSATVGNPVTVTVGNTAGNVSVFVNATLNGVTKMSSAVVITITATPPPTLSSVAVLPASDIVAAGGTTSPFTATPTCSAACPVGTTYFWTITNGAMGTLSATVGNPVTVTVGNTAGNVSVFVNATLNGVTKMSSAVVITITATPPPTLSSVAALPSSDIVATGGTTAPFTATPTCSAACPVGTTYFWSITHSAMGTLSATVGNPVKFTAGNTVGTVGLFVNATLNGVTKQSTAVMITISHTVPTLASVSIAPSSAKVAMGGTASFTVSITCNGGTCPAGVTYAWSLTNSLGRLNTNSGSAVNVVAGSHAGTVTLYVNATLQGRTVSSTAVITITSSSNPGGSGTNYALYAAIGIIAVLAVLAAIYLLTRGKKGGAKKEPTKTEGEANTDSPSKP